MNCQQLQYELWIRNTAINQRISLSTYTRCQQLQSGIHSRNGVNKVYDAHTKITQSETGTDREEGEKDYPNIINRKIISMSKEDALKRRWLGMRNRCYNKNGDDYRTYGAKGITVSENWMVFENFYKDMSNGFEESLVLDRIDPYGNYCKENCQWISKVENSTKPRRRPTPRAKREVGNGRSKMTVWLYPNQITRLKIMAGKKKLSVSDFIRKLIDNSK